MGSPVRPRHAAWRDLPVVTFALFFPLVMAWVYFVAMDSDEAQANRVVAAAYGVGKLVMLLPIVYLAWFEPGRLRLGRPTAQPLAIGVGFGLVVAAGIFALYFGWLQGSARLERTPALVLRKVQQFGQTDPAGFLLLALFLCVIHSLFEEYYWRCFVFGQLRYYLPLTAAIAISSLGFMLHHVVVLVVYLPGQLWLLALPFSLAIAVGGAFWAWLYHAYGSLLPCWLSHLLVDAAIMTVGYDLLAPLWR